MLIKMSVVAQKCIILQVGLVTYATDATIEFDLNDFQSVEGVIAALRDVIYTKGWTATALALFLTRVMLDPGREYGARPFSDGVPKVAVLLTDGRSNQISIIDRANNLRKFGVQVSGKIITKCYPLISPWEICRCLLWALETLTYQSCSSSPVIRIRSMCFSSIPSTKLRDLLTCLVSLPAMVC